VVMNPPSYDDRYVDHVLHAMEFLKPKGRLVALIRTSFWTGIPAGSPFDPAVAKVLTLRRRVIDQGRLYKIEWPEFKIDGCSVNAAIIVIDK
jgi:hypothetical protein